MANGKRRRLDALVLLVLGAAVLGTARCGGPGDDGDGGVCTTDASAVLEQVGGGVVLPTYQRFATLAAALEVSTAAYQRSLTDTGQDAARQAWTDAMDEWERAELMQIGPAASSGHIGGRDLRDEIYSWPITNRCGVDQAIVGGRYVDREAFATELVNVRGLDVLEYLLFYDGSDNACSALSPINTDGTWGALGLDELRRRRATYAATLAYLVRVQADDLVTTWDPAAGDFVGALTRPDGAPFIDQSAALNAVSDALFYLDQVTKDQKLDLATAADVESRYAMRSREQAIANVSGFEELFLGAPPGTDAPGFDDLLRAVSEDAVADRMTANLTAATASLEAIETPLSEAVVSDPASVRAAYEAVKLVTDDLKGRFVAALCLRIPAEAGGDTD